jgi:protein SCO1/2
LGDSFRDGRPVVLTLAYFRCPMLCGLVLSAVARASAELPFTPGDDYRFVTVSFDPKDRPADAARKQAAAVGTLGTGARKDAWSFLVGGPAEIHALADTLGFRFVYDERSEQYAHPAAAFVLTPDGRISRYLYGTDFSPRDLRLALVEAGSGKVGTIVDRILLTCYRFDPATRRFGPFVRGFMRVGGAFILAAVGLTLALLLRADRRRAARSSRAS